MEGAAKLSKVAMSQSIEVVHIAVREAASVDCCTAGEEVGSGSELLR